MGRKKVGLALSSGGWRGLAYIGIIKKLVESGIKIDVIVGSSAGALVGGVYAAIDNIELTEEFFRRFGYRDLLYNFSDPFSSSGLLRGRKPIYFLTKRIGRVDIEKMSIKFAAVATDLFKGEPVIINEGDLAEAIRASASVPFIFEPLEKDGVKLIDGGTVLPIPVGVAKEMGADVVIAVNPYTNLFASMKTMRTDRPSRMGVMKLAYYAMISKMAEENAKDADLIIEPKIHEGRFGIIRKFVNNKDVIDVGEEAMALKIDELRKMLE